MRVGRQAFAIDFLTKVVQLVFADAAFKERAGIDARCDGALDKNQIAAVLFGRGLKKVVEADVVEGC
ncbi:hypothetical protein D3C77_386000 [compost metagenome]